MPNRTAKKLRRDVDLDGGWSHRIISPSAGNALELPKIMNKFIIFTINVMRLTRPRFRETPWFNLISAKAPMA